MGSPELHLPGHVSLLLLLVSCLRCWPSGSRGSWKTPQTQPRRWVLGRGEGSEGQPRRLGGLETPGDGPTAFPNCSSAAGGICWLGGETRYPALRLGERGGRPHAERTPPNTLPGNRAGAPSICGSFGQLRPTPPQPLRTLRAVQYPPFTRGRGSRAPLVTLDMSVGRFLRDSTRNPRFPSNKSASTASVCGLSLRGVPKLVLMSSAPSVPADLGKEGLAVLRAGSPCPGESREDAIAAGRVRTWPGPGSGVEANPPVTSQPFPALPAPLF